MNFMAIHDDNWTKEFKKVDVVKNHSTFLLIWFILMGTVLYHLGTQIYQLAISNPTGVIRFSLVSSGIVMFVIAVKAALKLYVRNMK
jgi:hypothetical protein